MTEDAYNSCHPLRCTRLHDRGSDYNPTNLPAAEQCGFSYYALQDSQVRQQVVRCICKRPNMPRTVVRPELRVVAQRRNWGNLALN